MDTLERENPHGSGAAAAGNYQALIVNQPHQFQVHREIYTNPRIFEDELERIFATTWVYLAHDSELQNRVTIGRPGSESSRSSSLEMMRCSFMCFSIPAAI